MALLALAAAAPVHGEIDIPARESEGVTDYHMRLTVASGDPGRLAREHKARCEALGPTRCRVVQYMPSEMNYGDDSLLKVLLASGTAPAFMADISKASSGAGVNVSRNESGSVRNRGQLELERDLLQAQRDTLESFEDSDRADRRSVIGAERSRIENALERVERQLAQFREQADVDSLVVTYTVADRQRSSRLGNQLDELWDVLVVGFLAVTGAAVLTALYFGILGLAFLWLRKLAIKRGLVKGKTSGQP